MRSPWIPLAGSVLLLLASTGCHSEPPEPPPDLGAREPAGLFEVRYHHWDDLRQHTFSETGEDFDPDVSLDRRWLVFASTRDTVEPDVFIKEVDSRTAIRLTTHPGADRFPAVSPDGSMVAFSSDRNGNWDIYIVSTRGPGTLIEVTHGPGDEIAPCWSPDNTRLCYSARDRWGVWTIWVYNRQTQTLVNLGPGLFASWSPSTDPGQEWIAFQKAQQVGDNWYAIWIVRPDGTDPTQILSRPEWAAIHPAWSPDGRRIAFASVHKSRFSQIFGRLWKADDIWTIGADGTDLTNLTDHPSSDWSPTWAADGRIYFTSEREGGRTIWSLRPKAMDFSMPAQPMGPSGGMR